jgi:hypothetical protein
MLPTGTRRKDDGVFRMHLPLSGHAVLLHKEKLLDACLSAMGTLPNVCLLLERSSL